MADIQLSHLDDLRPALQFRHFRLVEQIGSGGQAVVWSALDTLNRRVIALKVSEPTADQAATNAVAFDLQSRLGDSLEHSHILPLYEFGQVGRLQFMATPYVSGGSLREWIQAEPLSSATILRVTTEIVSALDYLHTRRIVHRDLKPSNILLNASRQVFLADFGLARLTSENTQALHTGRGTPPYAPPEQHRLAELTPQSDIFSLGIMLYEMFAGDLPWQGQKTLGVQQLHTDDELPDLIDSTPQAPFGLIKVLRTFTAADPRKRPATVVQALVMLRDALRQNNQPVNETALTEPSTADPFDDASALLTHGLVEWNRSPRLFPFSLTKFLVIELGFTASNPRPLTEPETEFMLAGAFTYDYNLDEWWNQRAQPSDKLAICASLIESGQSGPIEKMITRLATDADIQWSGLVLTPAAITKLLELAVTSPKPEVTEQILHILSRLTAPATVWRAGAFGPLEDLKLAKLALTESPFAAQAAQLIGQARSQTALQRILYEADASQQLPLLITIHQAAGDLPDSVPHLLRLQISAEALLRELMAEPQSLVKAFGVTALANSLAFGLYVYITYRLPSFLDSTRLLISIERGLFLGVLVATGLVLPRAIMQRWQRFSFGVRAGLASLAGGLLITTSFWLYSLIFLDLPPTGWPILAGSWVIALGAAVSADVGRRTGILISFITLWAAFVLTWLITTLTGLSPLLFFEYSWSIVLVSVLCAMLALPIAIGTNLVNLQQT